MKKIITAGLLSTMGLCNLTFGSNPLEPNDEDVVDVVDEV